MRQQADANVLNWAISLRDVTLDISPLIAEKNLDFEIYTEDCNIAAHDWMLRELSRNLLHNAIKYSPADGALSVRLEVQNQFAQLTIRDSGQGISPELQERLFQPFSAGDIRTGSGLGLAICLEVVRALNGTITLTNRLAPHLMSDFSKGKVIGLDTVVRLPLQAPRSS